MEATITIRIFTIAISIFVTVAFIEFLYRLFKVIMIHKVIACIVRRVNIYHFHFAHIGVLEQFQHF